MPTASKIQLNSHIEDDLDNHRPQSQWQILFFFFVKKLEYAGFFSQKENVYHTPVISKNSINLDFTL